MQQQPTNGKQSPRRIRVERGLYYRQLPRGRRRYELTYLDSDGRRRWQVVDGKLEDARVALRNIGSRRDRGERVAPARVTFADFAQAWLDAQTTIRPRTREKYEGAIRLHLTPRLGRLRLHEVTEDTILALIADMRKAGAKPWTIRGVLTPLGRILKHAVRRGLIPSSPMQRLERGERPSVNEQKDRRILTTEEVRSLLQAALPTYRPLLATAVYSGMRLGELLGLTWADVDFDGGFLRVRRQADRKTRERVEPKTPRAVRDVVLLPALGKLLREHMAASRYSAATDPVFASLEGRPLHWRNVSSRGVEKAADKAKLNREGLPKITMHTLRRTFASHLILDLKLDPVQVSRLLGHSRPSITEDVYADLFDQARHADDIRKRMAESAFGNALETPAHTEPHSEHVNKGGEVVQLRAVSA